jgi:hypothetical protein
MEVSEDKKSTWLSLDTSPLFSAVSKLVQALVIIYDEISQALELQRNVLLTKPFLGPNPLTL